MKSSLKQCKSYTFEILTRYTNKKKRDSRNRYHELKVTLPSNYPFVPPQIIAYIPTQIESSLSIADIVNRHEQIIRQHQKLFDCLDDLDKHMRILEPEKPNRSDTWRKIALGHHCSLYLEITDPMSPFDKPQIRLFGSEKRVENLRKAWDHTFWLVQR